MLSKRLTEADVSIILALLQCKCSVFLVFGLCSVLVRASMYVNGRGLYKSFLVILISSRLLYHHMLKHLMEVPH